MYYHTPKVSSYVEKVQKHRLKIILGYLFVTVLSLFLYRPEFMTSDALFWLNESKEMQRTKMQSYEADHIGRLVLSLDTFDEGVKAKLNQFQKRLESLDGVRHVESLCSSYRIYNESSGEGSSLVKATHLGMMDAKALQAFVKVFDGRYENFVNNDFTKVAYYIYSSKPVNLDGVKIPYAYSYSEPDADANLSDYILYAMAVVFTIILFFRLLFHNYISALAALMIITLTLVATFTLSFVVSGSNKVHISMTLIVVSIALVDYLYFYYRWHVSQYKADTSRAMLKTINRNLSPAFWTTFITLIGLGPLLFVDSIIVQQLSLSVILASGFAYLLNLTLLPAVLSYFRVKHPKVEFARYCYIFANREIHYNKNYLKFFLGASTIVLIAGAYQLLFVQEKLFAQNVEKDIISISVPYNEVDLDLLKKIDAFETALKKENDGVKEVYSLLSVMKLFNEASGQKDIFSEQNYMQALFFLELYGLEENLINNDTLRLRVSLEDIDKNSVIHWLQNYHKIPIYFTDINSIIDSAKIDKVAMLGISLGTALIMIGVIMGWIFRNKEMVFVGFITNAIPIIWFTLFLNIFNIVLSLEVLIAMTITVGLASDATVHFAYKYYRSRFFGRTQKHALEIMFFYAGVPVIIGGIVLTGVFVLLTLTDVPSLELIGGYGASLMILSLLTDLLILPVLLLAIDRFGIKRALQ
ncbi:MMPL family transporter [Sulfurimonas sp. HSL3-7]|uniref:MMPL family transporter n=1 Tax=Sulfonitrofixus jiaomeiensis TaxID=3131938 RepID=UPI0031F9858E